MSTARLTVAIPTYNRTAILLRNLEHLLPQITQEVELLIVDNCSHDDPAPAIRQRTEAFGVRCRVMRNAINVGANANICRCIEFATTPHVWLLGDDDVPAPHAIEQILADIQAHPQASFINYDSEGVGHVRRDRALVLRGRDGLLEGAQSLGQLIFISSCVFNRDKIGRGLHLANFYQSTCAPQLITVLMSLDADSTTILSNAVVASNGADDTPLEQRTSLLPIVVGMEKLTELPLSDHEREHVRRLLTDAQRHWLTARAAVMDLFIMSYFHKRKAAAVWYHHRLAHGFFARCDSWKTWLIFWGGYIAIHFPGLFFPLVDRLYRKSRAETLAERAGRGLFARL